MIEETSAGRRQVVGKVGLRQAVGVAMYQLAAGCPAGRRHVGEQDVVFGVALQQQVDQRFGGTGLADRHGVQPYQRPSGWRWVEAVTLADVPQVLGLPAGTPESSRIQPAALPDEKAASGEAGSTTQRPLGGRDDHGGFGSCLRVPDCGRTRCQRPRSVPDRSPRLNGDHRHAQRRGKVCEAGVNADRDAGSHQQRRQFPQAERCGATVSPVTAAAMRSARSRSRALPAGRIEVTPLRNSSQQSAHQCASSHSLSSRLVAVSRTATGPAGSQPT